MFATVFAVVQRKESMMKQRTKVSRPPTGMKVIPLTSAMCGGSGSNTVFRNGETGILRPQVELDDGTLPLP